MRKSIVIAIIVLITAGIVGGAVYLLSQDESQTSTKQKPAVQQPLPEEEQPLSEEELTALWANGERCPEKGFAIPSDPEDLVVIDGIHIFISSVNINFTDDATCEDVERIALLLNAKIDGFEPTTDLYLFTIPTNTIEELEEAIATVKSLNDPKSQSVFKSVPLTTENFVD